MKKLLLLLASLATSYGQQFNGTSFDLDSGRIQVIRGEFSQEVSPLRQLTEVYKAQTRRLEEQNARMRLESELSEQTQELRRQTEYLRKLAEER